MSREELYLKIQQLGFAKAEAELFLDTHPTCKNALDYFHKIVRELDMAMTEYQNKYGALTTDGVMNTDRWTWVEGAWPWQHEENMIQPRGKE